VRGAFESLARVAYHADWPARVWARVPGSANVRVIERSLPMLPRGAKPIRVGFASDLHFGPTTPESVLVAAARALSQARLDVLLLGGDYVFLDATKSRVAALAAWVESIPARIKLAVLGNHDLWAEHDRIEGALRDGGARVLVNEHASLDAGGQTVVVGLDEPWTGRADVGALSAAGDAQAMVVLCHSPEAVPMTRDALAARPSPVRALYLCGHTHGGHVATPWGPVVVPGRFGRAHPSGPYTFPELSLFVSRGVGATEVAMRLFAPPDVLVLSLVAAESSVELTKITSPTGPPL